MAMYVFNVSGVKPTDQMVEYFRIRTRRHISLVEGYMVSLAGFAATKDERISEKHVVSRAKNHDHSKYSIEEKYPYIWLTEFYRCQKAKIPFEYPEDVKKRVDDACRHHSTLNRHHPEFFQTPNEMFELDIIEMVCDWAAMEHERKGFKSSPKRFADVNIGKRWKFDEEHTTLIYEVIEALDAR